MFGWTATGMDLAAWLSARLDKPCAAYVKNIGADLTMSCQAYGGKMVADVALEGDIAIAAVLAGSFPVEAGQGSTAATSIASPMRSTTARIADSFQGPRTLAASTAIARVQKMATSISNSPSRNRPSKR